MHWDGDLKIPFIVSDRSDSNYAKEPVTHESVSGEIQKFKTEHSGAVGYGGRTICCRYDVTRYAVCTAHVGINWIARGLWIKKNSWSIW